LPQAVTVLAVGIACLELGLGSTVAPLAGAGGSLAMLGAGVLLEATPSRHQRLLIATVVAWLFALANVALWPNSLDLRLTELTAFVLWPGVLVTLVLLAGKAGATRPSSVIHDSRCRAVWVVVGLTLATLAASTLAHRPAMQSPPLGFIVGGVGLVSLVAAVVLDIRALQRLRQACAGDGPSDGSRLDCGIGDEWTERVVNVTAGYRESARSVIVIRGSLPLAIAALRRAAVVHAIAVTVAIGTLVSGALVSSARRSSLCDLPRTHAVTPHSSAPTSVRGLPLR
jgi:hypothetical protein